MSAVADNLRRALALIDTPDKWWQGDRAARWVVDDHTGLVPCLPEDRGACCFCILGALAFIGDAYAAGCLPFPFVHI